jgi:hypothetical protein
VLRYLVKHVGEGLLLLLLLRFDFLLTHQDLRNVKSQKFILRKNITEKANLRVLQIYFKRLTTNLVFGRFVLGIVGNSLLEIRLKYKFVTFNIN